MERKGGRERKIRLGRVGEGGREREDGREREGG